MIARAAVAVALVSMIWVFVGTLIPSSGPLGVASSALAAVLQSELLLSVGMALLLAPQLAERWVRVGGLITTPPPAALMATRINKITATTGTTNKRSAAGDRLPNRGDRDRVSGVSLSSM